MSDTIEELAQTLSAFIQAADWRAKGYTPEGTRSEPRRQSDIKQPMIIILENACAKLSAEERSKCSEIIPKLVKELRDERRPHHPDASF
jgi:hypothetical protein